MGRDKNFQKEIMPYLDASYNLAIWLLRNPHDAEDAVQEAFLRAFHYYDGFDHKSPRAWILKIVYNCCQTMLKRNSRNQKNVIELERVISLDPNTPVQMGGLSSFPRPDEALISNYEQQIVRRIVSELSPVYKEVIVLREFEDLSYQEISNILQVSAGTVMSRLSRARAQILKRLKQKNFEGHEHELP